MISTWFKDGDQMKVWEPQLHPGLHRKRSKMLQRDSTPSFFLDKAALDFEQQQNVKVTPRYIFSC